MLVRFNLRCASVWKYSEISSRLTSSLVTWYREGKNVQRLLPHLSIYLGHGVLRDTQRYLSMTGELLQQASLCFERYARPEAPHV